MKLPHKLICIDLETTDSDSKFGSIIQIGAIRVNEDFSINEYDIFNQYIQPLDGYRNPKAMQVNGISEETMKSGMTLQECLDAFESYCGEIKFLSSWAAYFDIPFLREQYLKIGRTYPFSHKTLDLKSIAIWEGSKRDFASDKGVYSFLKTLGMEFDGKQHDALDDIKNSYRILKEFQKRS